MGAIGGASTESDRGANTSGVGGAAAVSLISMHDDLL
jgi:hypothetical protein